MAASPSQLVLIPASSAQNLIQPNSPTVRALTLRGAVGQSVPHLATQDSDGNDVLRLAPTGLEALSTSPFTSSAGGVVTPAHSSIFRIDPQGSVLIGPNKIIKDGTQQALTGWYPHSSVPEWIYDAITRRTYQRSAEMIELGDPADLVLGRMGTNNTYPDGTDGTAASLTGTLSGETLASIRFVGGVTTFGGTPGTTGGSSRQTTSAQISSQAAENFLQTTSGSVYATGADMRFWTCPVGAQVPVQRLRIFSDGRIGIGVDNQAGQLLVKTTNAARAAITAQGMAGQSTPIVDVADDNGNVLASIGQLGGLILNKTASDIIRVEQAASAAHNVLMFRTAPDASHRYIVRVDGRTYWGDGTNDRDVLLKRESAGLLAIRNGGPDSAYADLRLAKLGINGVAPPVQSADTAAQSTTAATQTTPWGFASQAQADAIATHLNDVRTCLRNHGLMA